MRNPDTPSLDADNTFLDVLVIVFGPSIAAIYVGFRSILIGALCATIPILLSAWLYFLGTSFLSKRYGHVVLLSVLPVLLIPIRG